MIELRTIRTGKNAGALTAKIDREHIEAAERLGRERALFWRTLACTGLRHGEARKMRIGDLVLEGDTPSYSLPAKHEKNRKGAHLPLMPDIAEALKGWIATRRTWAREDAMKAGRTIPATLPDDAILFPNAPASVRVFHRDRIAAGIAEKDARGRVVGIHSLRVSFGSMLAAAGVPLTTAQHLMRHSDPKLTASVYTDPAVLDLRGAVSKLPTLADVQEAARKAEEADRAKAANEPDSRADS